MGLDEWTGAVKRVLKDSRAPREHGRHYTPTELARRMVRSGLAAVEGLGPVDRPRILDPACGDGAFLLEVFDELCARELVSRGAAADDPAVASAIKLRILNQQVFGCDIDSRAVATLRETLIERVGVSGDSICAARSVVEANLRVGNSLTGPDFQSRERGESGELSLYPRDEDDSGIDWSTAYPDVARRGGFDLIVGNPPYVRERDARELFEGIAQTEFGRRWREARMDLWYYFAHRALDLLRSGGVLTFVVNSYWTASLGARRLIARFEAETSLEEIELLGTQPIFAGVSGRHLIFRVRKKSAGSSAVSASAPRLDSSGAFSPRDDAATACTIISQGALPYAVRHADLYQGGRLVLSLPSGLDLAPGPVRPLCHLFETRQGIAENPPAINRRLMAHAPGEFVLGEGVFVLRPDEVARLEFSEDEQQMLRPYFDTVAIGRYRLPDEPTHQLLYLTRQTAPSLDGYPRIRKHLERFRSILDRRRETREGSCAWWHLHWPREELHFTGPRLLSVQMGRMPQFVLATRPTFVGFSVNLVLARSDSSISLAALAGILNSEWARGWFDRHAKRRGVHLEINAHVLRQFPLPSPDVSLDSAVAECVNERQSCLTDTAIADQQEQRIEDLVGRWYRLPTVTSEGGKTSSTL